MEIQIILRNRDTNRQIYRHCFLGLSKVRITPDPSFLMLYPIRIYPKKRPHLLRSNHANVLGGCF